MIELETIPEKETKALLDFKRENPGFFQKNDFLLYRHLAAVIFSLAVLTGLIIQVPSIPIKILLGPVLAFLWFSLVNVTIHHHHTHRNAAQGTFARKFLDVLYFAAVPNAPKRLSRYKLAHLNHHARPYDETDVDHYYGFERFQKMNRNFSQRIFYYLELTFVGAYMPGWDDDQFMNTVPMEQWNRETYAEVKRKEKKKAVRLALFQWSLFFVILKILPALAWGWAYPVLLVKNWAHFLGQFQHYDERLLEPSRSVWTRTRTYRCPSWLNYLSGGEISGHFIHHLFPEMPYYQVETARRKFIENQELQKLFVTG